MLRSTANTFAVGPTGGRRIRTLAGPLGALGLLFTPRAMVLEQSALALPIVTALVHAASADLWAEYGAALKVDGAGRLRAVPHLLAMGRL